MRAQDQARNEERIAALLLQIMMMRKRMMMMHLPWMLIMDPEAMNKL